MVKAETIDSLGGMYLANHIVFAALQMALDVGAFNDEEQGLVKFEFFIFNDDMNVINESLPC